MGAAIQRRRAAQCGVEIAHQLLHATMPRAIQQMPIQRLVVIPVGPLPEFGAHEQQFVARVRPHQGQIGAQVGEAAPVVARHLPEQATGAVHHFIVGERQHEAFVECVHQPEGELAMVMRTFGRIALHVAQRVVHPAHVPFVREAQAAIADRGGHARPGGRFFGDGEHAGELRGDVAVELAQERDRLQILAAAMRVGHPLAFGTAVVAIQHRGHRIHAQAVEVVMLDPFQRAAQQVSGHFRPAVVVDQRIPVAMHAFARVGMLIQRGAVELGQPVRVIGKVRTDPIQDHADTGAMAGVDELRKAVRAAMARGGRIQAQRLIAPGTAKRVFGDRQQFDMGEAELLHIGNQLLGQGWPVQRLVVSVATPGRGMHLVDRQRPRHGGGVAVGHPGRVGPGECGGAGHHRCGCRRQFGLPRHRVGLEQHPPIGCGDGILVPGASVHAREEEFPEATDALPHRMPPHVPSVEVADHRHALGMGCPQREAHARHVATVEMLRAQRTAQRLAVACSDLQQQRFVQRGRKRVRVFDLLHPVWPHDTQPVRPIDRQSAFEDAIDGAGLHAREQLAAGVDQAHRLGTRGQHAHLTAAIGQQLRSKHRKGIGRQAVGQGLQGLRHFRDPFRGHAVRFRALLLPALPFAHGTVASAGAVAAVCS